jgi:tRNA A-37 threonylcarbamoyl transferase component Bud32
MWQYSKTADVLELRQLLESGDWRLQSTTVKQNPKRTVSCVNAPPLSYRVYIKHDHPTSPRDRVKNLWRCKAKQEFKAALALSQAGVPVTPALAWGRQGKDSYLVTRELSDTQEFKNVWEACRENPDRRQQFLQGLAEFLRALFTAGVVHPDMHAGNVLGQIDGERIRFFLVDVYGVALRAPLGKASRQALAVWLAGWIHELTDCEKTLFQTACTGLAPKAANVFWQGVKQRQTQVAGKHWPSRRAKLLKNSSLCERRQAPHGSWQLFRAFPLKAAESAVLQHRQNIQNQTNILKIDRKRQLTRVVFEGRTLVVKEFRRPGPWGRWRSDCRSWLNTYRLKTYGLPAAQCLAWLKHDDGQGFLILEDVGDQNLASALAQATTPRQQRVWLHHGARLVAWLHQSRIVHGDLKLSNMMVLEAPRNPQMPLSLIDSDSIRFNQHVTPASRAKNLHQMLDTFPAKFGLVFRLRFLACYRREAGLSRAEMRRVRTKLESARK